MVLDHYLPRLPSFLSRKAPWQQTAKEMQDRRDASIAAVQPAVPDRPKQIPLNVTGLPKKLLGEKEVEITEMLPEQLVEALANSTLSSVEVTTAFLRRAGLAQKLTNCITELLPERALARAAELDAYLKEHGKPMGPLHGLPISVKEHVGMKGLDLNAGFVAWVGQVADEDAHILQLLLNAGAVFYARTTEPQTLMHLETSSNLYGETVNPYNRRLTSGGSSGGEGSLIGLRGSCLGIGTDIGGSIRSPAANCGVYGFRPTSGRLPMKGLAATMIGQEHIVPVIGPLSTSIGGLRLCMRTLIDAKPWLTEASLLPIPWRDDTKWLERDDRPLTIGILWHDGVVKPHPPVQRALRELADKLKTMPGVSVVDWAPHKHDRAWEIISTLYFADGAAEEHAAIRASGEPYRPLSTFILDHAQALSVSEVWEWTRAREEYRDEYAAHWNATDVDVILCPVGPGAAPPLNGARYWAYTTQWNLLDYPAVVFPVTKVNTKIDIAEPEYVPLNAKDLHNYDLYKPEKYKDAPVSLQLVARRYEDEKLLEALELIQEKAGLPFVKLQ